MCIRMLLLAWPSIKIRCSFRHELSPESVIVDKGILKPKCPHRSSTYGEINQLGQHGQYMVKGPCSVPRDILHKPFRITVVSPLFRHHALPYNTHYNTDYHYKVLYLLTVYTDHKQLEYLKTAKNQDKSYELFSSPGLMSQSTNGWDMSGR